MAGVHEHDRRAERLAARHHGPRRYGHHEGRDTALAALEWNVRAVDAGDVGPGETQLRDWLRGVLARPGSAA
jgi:hypothetical protein